MSPATFDACKLLISNKKRNRQNEEIEEILEKKQRRSNGNKIWIWLKLGSKGITPKKSGNGTQKLGNNIQNIFGSFFSNL